MSKSLTTTNRIARPRDGMPAIHPGEILKHEYLEAIGMSATALARLLGVVPNRVTLIVAEKRSITADTAHLFAAFFGTTAQYWLNLQNAYDLRVAELDKKLTAKRKAIRPYSGRAA